MENVIERRNVSQSIGGSTFEPDYEGRGGGALLSTGGLKVYIPLILKGV